MMTLAENHRLPASPVASPEYLPFKLDLVGGRVLWLRLTAAQRRDAAFLDERALPRDAEAVWMPLKSLTEVGAAEGPGANAIFHIGHCGSTLLSRLLDGWSGVQGLREPLPLRTLADAWPGLHQAQSRLAPLQAEQLLRALWMRWSQPLSPGNRTLVKATSSCNGLLGPLFAQVPQLRTVLLDQPLRPYLATLLKSPTSVLDAAQAAGERLIDLQSRGFAEGVALHALSLPTQCAMGWLAERVRFAALAADPRVLRVDFESLLARPGATVHAVAAHLALDPAGVAAALESPGWGRYSKAQAHGYGRDDRAHDLALAIERHGPDIASGVAWVDACGRRYPALQAFIGS